MARASKICSNPQCSNLQPCEQHKPEPWKGSKRRERSTLSGSRQQKRANYILRKHDTICHICGYPGGTIADHVIPLAEGGADHEDNMRPAHKRCHDQKTAEEAARGRARA